MKKHRLVRIVTSVIVVLVLLMIAEVLFIKYNGADVPVPNIPRGTEMLGSGPPLTYIVMGDSTSIGQGADYSQSYAVASAQLLAQTHRVTFVNVGVSGARAQDVLASQLSKAVKYKPDVVLLAVGANDAKDFVRGNVIRQSIQRIVNGLQTANCKVRIVVTGSPAMDAPPRFIWPAKQIMGLRTRQVNSVFAGLVAKNHLTFAPIAAKTRATFLANPTLFAADKFHPNARGYAVWKPVINVAIKQALAAPSGQTCPKT